MGNLGWNMIEMMKTSRLSTVLLLVIVVVTGSVLAACKGSDSTLQPTSDDVARITIDELLALMDSQANILIVDTRSTGEYNLGHITGSVSAPLSVILNGEWEPPVYEQLILYCS